ncbi:nucleotidyl transferase AbiEii/AbiGii toxin family protein [Candidatus Margulisiibacteriota bacterium]
MLIEDIKNIVAKETEKGTRSGYIINLIKEYLQNITLEFLYSNKNTNNLLVFTGGTCLRFCFNLPRLSEDLDFDTASVVGHTSIGEELKNHFKTNLKYNDIDLVIKGKEKKIYLKFPLLDRLNLKYEDSLILLLKVEICKADLSISQVETSLVEKEGKTYFLKRYSLEDMMAGKINAFLTRLFYKGKTNEVNFKGRDIYDLVWFMGKGIKPNLVKLKKSLAGTRYEKLEWGELLNEIKTKTSKIKKSNINLDLANFIETPLALNNFLNCYIDVIGQYCNAYNKK